MPDDQLGNLRVLYCSHLTPDYYGEYRFRALRRLGLADVQALDVSAFGTPGLLGKLEFRLQAGMSVRRLNHAVLQMAELHGTNVLLCDKVLGVWPSTLRKLRQRGVVTVDYVIDNPFGPRRDPGWRLYRKALPEYDLHAVPRSSSVLDYRRAGAREVMEIRVSYEPTIHFAPSPEWSDADRTRQVSFIGTPYDQRAAFLDELWRSRVPLSISGSRPHWEMALPAGTFAQVFRDGELKGPAYREAIWRSRINLAFVTRSNRDVVAHKSFEIAACGGFLLAERTPEHQACFAEDAEAVFFSDLAECQAKVRRYLEDESARARIAAAGHGRALSSGYDNDTMLRRPLARAAALLAQGRR